MQDIGISVLRCRRRIHSEKIGAAGPRWPTSNRNHRRDETHQDDRFGVGGPLSQPRECSAESLREPEIVGEITNPALEIMAFWWRAFDRVCYCFVLVRLSIRDRICGPEPPTSADLKREPITSGWSGRFQLIA